MLSLSCCARECSLLVLACSLPQEDFGEGMDLAAGGGDISMLQEGGGQNEFSLLMNRTQRVSTHIFVTFCACTVSIIVRVYSSGWSSALCFLLAWHLVSQRGDVRCFIHSERRARQWWCGYGGRVAVDGGTRGSSGRIVTRTWCGALCVIFVTQWTT